MKPPFHALLADDSTDEGANQSSSKTMAANNMANNMANNSFTNPTTNTAEARRQSTIQNLRQMLQPLSTKLSEESLAPAPSSLWSQWLYRKQQMNFRAGDLVEITGSGRTEWTLQFLREHPKCKTLWIEAPLTLNPFRIAQLGIPLSQICILSTTKDLLWALEQILASAVFDFVILSFEPFSDLVSCKKSLTTAPLFLNNTLSKEWRRLFLAIEKSAGLTFWLTKEMQIRGLAPRKQVVATCL